uniref:Uncharacterized protein n=1 Tax=Nelumbo nucifera TaxID=4432 RepID=A0A822ZDX5_NELNU|nr:TPA_asm: hypothetical protein HUJ06_001013 [Nelumbo nucifera]
MGPINTPEEIKMDSRVNNARADGEGDQPKNEEVEQLLLVSRCKKNPKLQQHEVSHKLESSNMGELFARKNNTSQEEGKTVMDTAWRGENNHGRVQAHGIVIFEPTELKSKFVSQVLNDDNAKMVMTLILMQDCTGESTRKKSFSTSRKLIETGMDVEMHKDLGKSAEEDDKWEDKNVVVLEEDEEQESKFDRLVRQWENQQMEEEANDVSITNIPRSPVVDRRIVEATYSFF